MSGLFLSAASAAPWRPRLRLAVAGIAAGAVVAPAAPAAAQDADRYEVDVTWPAADDLPEGADLERRRVPVAPEIETASAPGGWLAPKTVEEVELTHTVQSGDSLGDLAAAYGFTGGDGWRVLFDANSDVSEPWHIWPGLQLAIPADGEALRRRDVPEPPPEPEPQREQAPEPQPARTERARASRGSSSDSGQSSAASNVSGGRWDQLAACESGGNWSINTGNGYYGGLQFSLSSWQAVGGSGYPHQASKAEQIRRAEMLLARQGWGAWPACTRKLGWR